MNYPLDQLHQVRSLREKLAQSDLAQGRNRLDQADQELNRTQADLESHRLHQSQMEARLFEEIACKKLTLNELEIYRGRMTDLRTEEENFRERVRQAKTQKDATRAEVDRLSAVFQQRCRESTKLEQHRKVWKTGFEDEIDQRMEDEMEEMVVHRFSRNDTDG